MSMISSLNNNLRSLTICHSISTHVFGFNCDLYTAADQDAMWFELFASDTGCIGIFNDQTL